MGSAYPSGFPTTIAPAFWLDMRQPAFADLAGTTPAVIGGPLGRVNEASPLSGNWQAPTTGQRPRADPGSARMDYCATDFSSSQSLVRTAAVALPGTDATLAVSFMARDASQSPQSGILRSPGYGGLIDGNGLLSLTYNNAGANWTAAIPTFTKGQRVSIVARLTATTLKMQAMIDGVSYSDSLTVSVTGSAATNPFTVGAIAGADGGVYGSLSHAIGVGRAISDSEAVALAAWLDVQPVPAAFPLSQPLFGVIGDSIARGNPGGYPYQVWAFSALQNIRVTYPGCEMCNAAVGGSGVTGMYTPIIPFYSPSRNRNVLVVAGGTNDLANNNGQVFTRDGLFAACDAARAQGWKVALATILDRTGSLTISQASFDSQRAFVNAAITGSGTTHADALIDLTGIANLSANGAANNATYFSADLIHPIAAGHALMEPVYRAAMLTLAA